MLLVGYNDGHYRGDLSARFFFSLKNGGLKMSTDSKYKTLMAAWYVVIISWVLFAMVMQAGENTQLRSEREYLRTRLFVEMNLRSEVQKTVELQKQIHVLYETEIWLLRQQMEMSRVSQYLAKVNPSLSIETRVLIVQAAYYCSARVGLDPLFTLAVIEQESRFNVYAKSFKGALGLMQLMPRTATKELGIPIKQIYDIELNVCGGAAYLARHLKTHDGDQRAALRRYYGGGDPAEYSQPVLIRYENIQRRVRM